MQFRTKAPFGVQTKRFDSLGMHPNLDPIEAIKRDKRMTAPGCYEPVPFECAYKKYNIGGSPWKRKTITEEFSKNLGYRNSKILSEREFRKKSGGPGNYDYEEFFKKKSPSCFYDTSFGLQKRFKGQTNQNFPPPGTYGKDIATTPVTQHKQFTNVPTFEWDGFIDRFKGNVPAWKPAPNRYNPKDEGSIAAKVARVVSKRGPYDCFTGPRDGSTIKNHFAPPAFKGPINFFNTWPNELEILFKHPRKQLYGRFLKADRCPKKPTIRTMLNDISLCYKDPDDPSPAHYSVPFGLGDDTPNDYPFNSSSSFARPQFKWHIQPGPGRYAIKSPKCPMGKTESWVFKSKTERKVFTIVEYNSF